MESAGSLLLLRSFQVSISLEEHIVLEGRIDREVTRLHSWRLPTPEDAEKAYNFLQRLGNENIPVEEPKP